MALTINEPVAEVQSTTNASTYAMTAFTPTANALLVVLVFATGTVAAGSMTGGGLTWTRQTSQLYNTTDTAYVFTAKVGGSPASTTITFDCTGDAATGANMRVHQITGTNVQFRQAKANAASSTNPTVTFDRAPLNTSAIIAGFGINRTTPGSTPPTRWTDTSDGGYSTPNSGASTAYRNGGLTSDTITFTAATGNWAALAVEVWEEKTNRVGGYQPLLPNYGNLKLWIDARNNVNAVYDEGIDAVGSRTPSAISCTGVSPNRPVWLKGQLHTGKEPSLYFPNYEQDWLNIIGPDDPSSTAEYGIVCPNGYTAFATFKTLGADTTSIYEGNPPMPIIGNRHSWIYNAFGLSGGNVQYRNYDAAWSTTTSSGLTLNNGNVHTVAVVHSTSGNVTLYADGVSVATASGVGFATAYTGAATIGYSYNGDQALDLNLGECMVWDETLTAAQIAWLHTRGIGIWG